MIVPRSHSLSSVLSEIFKTQKFSEGNSSEGNLNDMPRTAQGFYDDLFEQPYRETRFAHSESAEEHWLHPKLTAFIEEHDLGSKRCLEVGTGYGQFQHLVPNYVGIDIAFSSSKYMQAPFVNASAMRLPFRNDSFDCVWSNHVLEHVDEPELMLEEIWRVLRPGGFLFLTATWQCAPWLANGYPVRPFSDLNFKEKLIKLSVPIRGSVLFRSLKVFPRRMITSISQAVRGRPTKLRFGRLRPSYDRRWMPDSTAESSVEPFDVYMWYTSRGAQCLNYPSKASGFLIRTGHITFQKPGTVAEADHSSADLEDVLVCPQSRTDLLRDDSFLTCVDPKCRLRFEIDGGIPRLLIEEARQLGHEEWSDR